MTRTATTPTCEACSQPYVQAGLDDDDAGIPGEWYPACDATCATCAHCGRRTSNEGRDACRIASSEEEAEALGGDDGRCGPCWAHATSYGTWPAVSGAAVTKLAALAAQLSPTMRAHVLHGIGGMTRPTQDALARRGLVEDVPGKPDLLRLSARGDSLRLAIDRGMPVVGSGKLVLAWDAAAAAFGADPWQRATVDEVYHEDGRWWIRVRYVDGGRMASLRPDGVKERGGRRRQRKT